VSQSDPATVPAGRVSRPQNRRSRRQRGQAMIEFALTFPFLLLLSVSVVDYGHYEETTNNLATVIRDGTRYATLQPASTGCTSGSTNCSSDTVQGVLQAEAESLTVPEGGLTLTNINCTWSGSDAPPALSASPGAPDAPASSCITVAYYTNDTVGTSDCAYFNASTGAVTGTCTAATASYVQITVCVASSDDDNPLTLTLNSTFGLKLTIARSFVMSIEPGV